MCSSDCAVENKNKKKKKKRRKRRRRGKVFELALLIKNQLTEDCNGCCSDTSSWEHAQGNGEESCRRRELSPLPRGRALPRAMSSSRFLRPRLATRPRWAKSQRSGQARLPRRLRRMNGSCIRSRRQITGLHCRRKCCVAHEGAADSAHRAGRNAHALDQRGSEAAERLWRAERGRRHHERRSGWPRRPGHCSSRC